MQTPLALTTLLMGLAGGPHCIAMCGAACGSLQRNDGANNNRIWKFHLGRIIGYSSLGAIAAGSVKTLAWFSSQTQALHPLWTFFHVLVLCWGLMLLAYARQPAWADQFGRRVWKRVQQATHLTGGGIFTGMLWALMPCGLLYSALLVASLNANPISGALSMTTFAIGTSLSLIVGPWFWFKLKKGVIWLGEDTSMRLAGFFLVGVATWAIWMDLVHQVKVWCN
ncbi:MAG: sulfite exporter TauE/SafE family protein [Methylophilaceae bacterium]